MVKAGLVGCGRSSDCHVDAGSTNSGSFQAPLSRQI